MSAAATAATGVIARSIRTKLSSLNPVFLDVINESHKHNVPKGSESHFKGNRCVYVRESSSAIKYSS